MFADFPYFNNVQSTVFKDVFHSNKNLVISAPTSSGKTVILEIAIIRLLTSLPLESNKRFKIIYSIYFNRKKNLFNFTFPSGTN